MPTAKMTRVALVGTARAANAAPETDTPVDLLTLPLCSTERALLLRAGAHAVYALAGGMSVEGIETPAPAAPETLPECSPAMARALDTMLSDRFSGVLPEALGLLTQQGRRLPHALVPLALAKTPHDDRPAMAPVLGERGRWLSQFQRSWEWAQSAPADGTDNSLKTVWDEGKLTERVHVLRLRRGQDPATAREWLSAVWKQEKPEARLSLLGALEVGLGADDEPFLAMVQSDRSEQVRTMVTRLLIRVSTSAAAQRLRAHGVEMLTLTGGKLVVSPRREIDAELAKQGLSAPPGQGKGARAQFLMQVLERVPPSYWEAHFQRPPEALIAGLADSPWRVTVLEAWTEATHTFGERRWADPLWEAWLRMPEKDLKQAEDDRESLCLRLAPWMPPSALEAYAMAIITGQRQELDLDIVLPLCPRPWSAALATAYLAGLRAFVGTLTVQSKSAEPWNATLRTAALSLPVSHFALAAQPLDVPDAPHPQITHFKSYLEAFAETIGLRQTMYRETQA
jgi:hypothetical protein